MVHAYQGYFCEDGRFITNDLLVKIPPRRRAIVTILEDEMIEASEKVQNAIKIKKILANAEKFEDCLSDDDWDEMANLRTKTNLSRAVDV